MKLLKRLILVAALLIIVAVGLVVFGLTRIDAIFKAGVEKGGTWAMGVETRLASADVQLTQGSVAMSGLTVANPPGYKSDKFLGLGSGSIQVALPTIDKPVIEVPSLKLADIRVNLEKESGKANYKVILDNLAKLKGSSQQPGSPPTGPGSEKKFIINEVDIKNVVVHVDLLPLPGVSGVPGASALTQVDVPIDEITLKNVGTAGGGLPAGELAMVIVNAVLKVATEKGAGIIPADVLGDLQGLLPQLGDLNAMGIEVQGKLNEAAEGLKKEAEKQIDKTVDEARKKLEDLIPGKKK